LPVEPELAPDVLPDVLPDAFTLLLVFWLAVEVEPLFEPLDELDDESCACARSAVTAKATIVRAFFMSDWALKGLKKAPAS
jgi:hypothetical protein